MSKTIVIAIDGPAGAGKSTVAKALAQKLNFSYLDTGAMYRGLTLKALRQKINLDDPAALASLAEQTTIDLKSSVDTGLIVLLDGEDVTEEIRTLEVTNNTFYVARTAEVRAVLVQWQRAIGERQSVVAEGRDVGTVVFPDATNKFYLDANVEERSQRRIKELQEKGNQVDEEKLKSEIKERDEKDLTRRASPLKKADDAVFIDSTDLSVEQVVDKMLEIIKGVNAG